MHTLIVAHRHTHTFTVAHRHTFTVTHRHTLSRTHAHPIDTIAHMHSCIMRTQTHTTNKQNTTDTQHSHTAHTQTYSTHIYMALQSCKHVSNKVNSFLKLPLRDKVARQSLRNPPSVNFATCGSNTCFLVQRERVNTLEGCRLKKAHCRESLAFPQTVHNQEKAI